MEVECKRKAGIVLKANIGINGFGRIGRMVFRRAILDEDINIVAINASYPAETLAHLLKYDTTHRQFDGEVSFTEDHLIVSGKKIALLNDRDPRRLPWVALGVDIVIEATGAFRDKETASYHIESGAKKVIITAPAKDEDITIVMGVNEEKFDPINHTIVSNASCTTNCLAPVAKVIDKHFEITDGLMTSVHAYTNGQNNIDNPYKDLRRARACGQNIIPTTTGAAKAISLVLPQLAGKMHGMALRVPTSNVSLVDLVVNVRKETSKEEVNDVLKKASEDELKGILGFNMEPLVSSDYITDPHSAIVDGLSTMVMNEKQVKVMAWYDNEWGYSCRVVDLARYISEKM